MNAITGIRNGLGIMALIGICFYLSACGFSRGWQVNFGVSPVSSIDNNQGFQAEDAPEVRKVRR
jgi:hypothetical protein